MDIVDLTRIIRKTSSISGFIQEGVLIKRKHLFFVIKSGRRGKPRLLDQPHDFSQAPNAKGRDQSEIDSLAPARSAFGLLSMSQLPRLASFRDCARNDKRRNQNARSTFRRG